MLLLLPWTHYHLEIPYLHQYCRRVLLNLLVYFDDIDQHSSLFVHNNKICYILKLHINCWNWVYLLVLLGNTRDSFCSMNVSCLPSQGIVMVHTLVRLGLCRSTKKYTKLKFFFQLSCAFIFKISWMTLESIVWLFDFFVLNVVTMSINEFQNHLNFQLFKCFC